MRILLYCPLNPTAPRLQPRTWESIQALEFPGQLDILLGRSDHAPQKEEDAYNEIADKYEAARRVALEGAYDALFTVEADMILPPMALERLTRIETDVAYGLYCSRRGGHRWLAFSEITETGGKTLYEADPQVCKDAWGQVVETAGVGMGCTLIWWHVLKSIRFRRKPHSIFANDWFFALDCRRRGFRQMHDFGTVCGHIDGGSVYWPDPEIVFRVEG